jgi:hypothetical protein
MRRKSPPKKKQKTEFVRATSSARNPKRAENERSGERRPIYSIDFEVIEYSKRLHLRCVEE